MGVVRPPYQEVAIKDINREAKRIALAGILISKEEERFILDDGTGSINVLGNTELPLNTFVKVYGQLLIYPESYALQSHAIQDLSSINQQLYKKVKSMLS